MPRRGKSGRVMKGESCDCENCGCGYGHWHGKRAIFFGIVILIVGLLLNMGYSWSTILIVIGILVILKGLFVKFGMM